MARKTTTTRTDHFSGEYGNWQSGMFVRFDWTHPAARTFVGEQWDGSFTAPCPHGEIAQWRSLFGYVPQCLCECR
jgi:hypothetical protein